MPEIEFGPTDGRSNEYTLVAGQVATALTTQDARNLFFTMGDYLGYTWTHRTQKKPALDEPIPQARQDIAATATLHGMGHIWDGEKWKAPQLVLLSGVKQGFNLVDSLRTRITELTQQTLQQNNTLQRNTKASKKMAYALQAIRDTLELPKGPACGGRVEDGVLEAVQELQQKSAHRGTCLMAIHDALGVESEEYADALPAIRALKSSVGNTEWADKELNRIGNAVGIAELGECSATFIVPAIEALNARNTALTLDNAGAFAALRDHGHTPLTSADSLGTLIRDAFGAEAAKLRRATAANPGEDIAAALRDQGKLDQKWTMGRIAGEQQERKRCYSIIDRAIAANTPNVNASDSIFHHMQGAQHALLQVRKEITDPTL